MIKLDRACVIGFDLGMREWGRGEHGDLMKRKEEEEEEEEEEKENEEENEQEEEEDKKKKILVWLILGGI